MAAPTRSESSSHQEPSSSQPPTRPLAQAQSLKTLRRSDPSVSGHNLRKKHSQVEESTIPQKVVNPAHSISHSMSGRTAGDHRTNGIGPKMLPTPPAPQSGLVQAAFSNGREKGSSATPIPTKSQPLPSPTPARNFQDELDKMNRSMSQGSSYGGFPPKDNRPPVAYSHTRGSNSSSTHVSNLSFGSTGQTSSTQLAFNGLSIADVIIILTCSFFAVLNS